MTTKEQLHHNSLTVGEYVRNVSKNSKYYGRVGRIVYKDDYSVHVKYEGFKEVGKHPARILIKTQTEYFEDDLFTVK